MLFHDKFLVVSVVVVIVVVVVIQEDELPEGVINHTQIHLAYSP